MKLTRLVILCAVAAAACSAMRVVTVPPKLPGTPVPMWTLELDNQSGTVLYARNDSTVVLDIRFRLHGCTNVRNACAEYANWQTVQPAQVVVVDTIRPVELSQPYTFNWAYAMR